MSSRVHISIKHEGSLKAFGYHVDEPMVKRKKALIKASKIFSRDELIRKLNALAVLFKNKYPAKTIKVQRDMEFVRSL